MNFTHLTSEEIAYELALRHVVNLSSMTHRNKVMRLKDLVDEDNAKNTVYNSSEHVMDPSVNIDVCVEGIKQLQIVIERAHKLDNSHDLTQAHSRLIHYQNRLAIINPPENSVETLNSLRQIVNTLFASVSDVAVKSVNQSVNSDRGAIKKTPQVLSAAQVTGMQDGSAAIGIASNYPTENEGHQQQLPQLPLLGTPEGTGRGRGRGSVTPQRTSLNQRFNSSSMDEIRRASGENMARQDQRNIDSGDIYNQLRNDLINDLVRLHVQRGERTGLGEERRIQKAIHNWPFKFRGEKDTKSLNTYLDRVESFAMSEGVSEEVLLTSVKHLLQDDALDWYARAISQGLLTSWEAFKEEIRREYLPAEYGQFIRAEAFFRYQGQTEPFVKYYREIVSLFRFAQPKMSETEKFFIVKKNMNAEYAPTVAAARPRTLEELVEVCASYDDTKLLLNRQQRRVTIPHESLLEPNLATPAPNAPQRHSGNASSSQRFGRIHAVELEQLGESHTLQPYTQANQAAEGDEEYWHLKMDQLMEQVNAIRTYVDRRYKKEASTSTTTPKTEWQRPTPRFPQQAPQQHFIQRQLDQQSGTATALPQQQTWQQENHQQPPRYRQFGATRAADQETQERSRMQVVCWNCEEDGHRHADCKKPQTFLFCHGCGRRGYTLRNCYICLAEAENMEAGNLQ